MVRIRLRRVGRKKAPVYRIVVADSQSPRDGKFIEIIGQYAPRQAEGGLNDRRRARQLLARRRRAAERYRSLAARRAGVLKRRHEQRLGIELEGRPFRSRSGRRRGSRVRRKPPRRNMARHALAIIGRIRKAQGIKGELLVEPITDTPDALFASGRRVFVGDSFGNAPGGPTSSRSPRSSRSRTGLHREVRRDRRPERGRAVGAPVPLRARDELAPPRKTRCTSRSCSGCG